MSKGFAWKIFLWLIIAPGTILAATETVTPVIDPAAAEKIIGIIILITAQFPFGIWVALGFTVLGLLVTVARMAVQFIPGDRDDLWVEKYLGWIPTAVSMKTANKVSGKGKVDIDAIAEVLKRHKSAIEAAQKNKKPGVIKKLLGLMLVFALAGTMTTLIGCPKKIPAGETPAHEQTVEQVQAYLFNAQKTVNKIREELPTLYNLLDTFCSVNPPDWCKDKEIIKADMADGLDVVDRAITRAQSLLDEGAFADPGQVAQEVINALVDVALIYARILTIVNRHQSCVQEYFVWAY